MDSVAPSIVVVVLALACPLCTLVMGAIAWVVARHPCATDGTTGCRWQ